MEGRRSSYPFTYSCRRINKLTTSPPRGSTPPPQKTHEALLKKKETI